jgi:hypothetical protein
MATFKQNGITFTALQGAIKPAGKISMAANGTFSDAGTDGVEPFVNAVEIDWNGGVLPNSDITAGGQITINNTGEILWSS